MHGCILSFFIISSHTIYFKSCKKIILQPHKYACANWSNSFLCHVGGELHASRQWEEPRGAGEGAELWHNQPGEGEDIGRHLQECSLFAQTKSFWHGPGYDKHYAIFRCLYPLNTCTPSFALVRGFSVWINDFCGFGMMGEMKVIGSCYINISLWFTLKLTSCYL